MDEDKLVNREPETPDPYVDLETIWAELPPSLNRVIIEPVYAAAAGWTEVFVALRCARCRGFFLLGINGTVNGCDACCGVRRDLAGHWWDRRGTFVVPVSSP